MASATVGILRALLSANVAEFESDMKRAGNAVLGLSRDFKTIGSQATQLGTSLTKVLTVPILGLGVAASKFAIDFESSFAGVRKTVDATDAEFAEMAQGFRDLAKTIPINVNELNRLGEAAGALGIPKTAIVDFARVMGLLGETTNLTADQAAESIAKIQNIFGAAGKDTERFASTLVALGNDGASTEDQIVSMATRIAGAGNAIGLTQGQVLAFASALSSVGIEAEMGGSAISRVFIDIASAVSQGGKEVEGFAKVAGVSIDQFSQRFKDDAAGAVAAFIAGLSQIKESGGDLIGTLEKLGFTEIRVRDTLLRAAGAGNLLTDALNLQARAWRENSALTIEAGKRFETTASQLVLLWNRLKDVGITLGNALLPLIKSTIGVFDQLIPVLERITTGFAKLPVGMQASIAGLLGLAAAAGPALFVFGQLSFAASQVIGMFTAKGLAMKALIPLFGALTGPIGVTVAAIIGGAGLVAAIAAATGKWDALISTLKGAGSVLVESARLLADLVSLGLKPLIESAKFTFDWIGKLKGLIDSSLIPSLDAARRATEENAFALGKTGLAAQQAGGFFENLANGIRAWRDALNGVKPPLVDVGGRIGGLVTSAGGLNTGFQQVARQGAAQFTTALTGTNTAAKKLKDAIADLRDELSGAKLQGDVNKLVGALRLLTPAQIASEDVSKRLTKAIESLGLAFDKLPPSLQQVAFGTQKVTEGFWSVIPPADAMKEALNGVEQRAREAIPIFTQFGDLIGTDLPVSFGNAKTAMEDFIKSLPVEFELPPPDPGFFAGWAKMISEELPRVILGAIQGGGRILESVGSAIGIQLGTSIVKSFGKSITGTLGKVFGDVVNNLIPGLGALLGPLLGKIGGWIKKLFGGPSDAELAGRDVAADFRRGLEAGLNERQRAEAIATGNFNWAASVIAIRDAYLAAGRTEAEALAISQRLWAAEKQGPEAVQRVIEEINAVIGEHNELLQQTGDEARFNWEAAEQAAARYGVRLGSLGSEFEKARLGDKAAALLSDWELLTKGIGVDLGGVLFDMREEVSALVRDFIAAGQAIPAGLRPLVEELIRSGNLLDENGNALTDLGRIRFTDTIDETEDATDATEEWHTQLERAGESVDGLGGQLDETPFEEWARRAREAADSARDAFSRPFDIVLPPIPTLPSPSAPPSGLESAGLSSAFARGFALEPNVASSAVTVHQYVTIEGMIDSDNLRRIHDEHLLPLQEDAIMFNRGPQGLRTVIRKHTR